MLETTKKPRAKKRRKPQAEVKIKADWAKLDPSLFGLALFRPIQKGSRPRVQMEGEFAGEHIEVISAFSLGADDLSILLAILTLAGQRTRGRVIRPAEKEEHRPMILDLDPRGAAVDAEHITVEVTSYELIETAGMTVSGAEYARINTILKRLRGVFYVREVMQGNKRVAFSSAQETLLYYQHTEDGLIKVTLSERLSRALLRTPFDMLWMPDYRALQGAVARILLTRLAVLVRGGSTVQYRLDSLIPVVYGEDLDSLTSMQVRDRRRSLREALKEVAALPSWRIEQDHRAVISLTNLRVKGRLIEPTGQMMMALA